MGSGQSNEQAAVAAAAAAAAAAERELLKPSDASDLGGFEEAKAELVRLRRQLHTHASYLSWRFPALSEPPTYRLESRSKILQDGTSLEEECKQLMESILQELKRSVASASELRGTLETHREIICSHPHVAALACSSSPARVRGIFVQDGPPIPALLAPGADWSGFALWLMNRIRCCNSKWGKALLRIESSVLYIL